MSKDEEQELDLENKFSKYSDDELLDAIRELYAELARRRRVAKRINHDKYRS